MQKKKKVISRRNSIKRKNALKENKAPFKRKSYLQFSWHFMALIFVLAVAMFATIEWGITDIVSFHPLEIIALIATFVAGCSAVKNGFEIGQVWVIGALCFLAIGWTIPLSIYEYYSVFPITSNYLAINILVHTLFGIIGDLAVYIVVALIGGAISSRVR